MKHRTKSYTVKLLSVHVAAHYDAFEIAMTPKQLPVLCLLMIGM